MYNGSSILIPSPSVVVAATLPLGGPVVLPAAAMKPALPSASSKTSVAAKKGVVENVAPCVT